MINWRHITKFCFTYALVGGAWLEDSTGHKDWFSFNIIQRHFGQNWIDKQMTKTGWMTGCWITAGN